MANEINTFLLANLDIICNMKCKWLAKLRANTKDEFYFVAAQQFYLLYLQQFSSKMKICFITVSVEESEWETEIQEKANDTFFFKQ